MLDAQLQTIIQSTLIAGLAARGISGVSAKQNNQPRQFAAPSSPTIFFTYGGRKKWGWPSYADTLNEDGVTFTRTVAQVVHTRFQIAGFTPASPSTPEQYTSGDLSSIAADILTFEDAISAYVAQGCNVLRVQDLPGVWFQDSSGQNVLWSSFDIIFTHKDVFVSSTPTIGNFAGSVNRI